MTYQQFLSQFYISLNEQQQQAVQAVQGPTVLLAVPGSGKTTVLVTRLGYMTHCRGVRAEEILTMTYTVAATRDMRARYAAIFGEEAAEKMEFRTINGVSVRIIQYYERMLGRTAFQLQTDEGVLSGLVGEIYGRVNNDFAAESDIRAIRTAITYAKNMLLSPQEREEMDKQLPGFSSIFQEYDRVLRQRGQMDYDDQMVYAWRILRQYPEILQVFRRRYRHICVDEAQDTSKIQHLIIDLLAQGGESLFMVGDEDQSIYGFRAAYPQALMDFEKNHPGAKVLLLEQNYRSTQQIVSLADSFIRRNQNRRDKSMKAVRGEGCAVREIAVADRRVQYNYLKKVAQDCQKQTAVLYRDNDCALALIDMLERADIPYRCRQMDSTFFTHRIVRDICDIIRFAQRPEDGEIFMRVYYKLGAGISKAAAERAVRLSGGEEPILEQLCVIEETSPWTKRQCRALQTHLVNLLHERADRAVYRIVHFMGYGDYLEQRGADPHKAQILEILGQEEPTPIRLLERLEELREIVQEGSANQDCPFILSTIHSSKGLEYERVFLMDVIDGILPKIKDEPGEKTSQEEKDAYEEERRLFYVGMTRAKDELAVFTFGKDNLCSTFSGNIFPKKMEKKVPVASKTYPIKLNSSEGQTQSAEEYCAGTRVSHRQFGPGTMTGKQGDIASISFDNGTEKRFSLSAALRSGALKKLDT